MRTAARVTAMGVCPDMRDFLRADMPEKLLLLAGARVLHADQKAAARAVKR